MHEVTKEDLDRSAVLIKDRHELGRHVKQAHYDSQESITALSFGTFPWPTLRFVRFRFDNNQTHWMIGWLFELSLPSETS